MHLLQSNCFGGAENVVCQIINITKDVDELQMVYVSTEGSIRETLSKKDVSYYGIKRLNRRNVREAISILKPDIVHAHDMRASFIASISCGNIPLVFHIHNNNPEAKKINLRTLLFLFASFRSTRIFWVSESAFNSYRFKSIVNNKSEVLYNILDIDSVKNRAETANIQKKYDIAFVGRLIDIKNPKRLLGIIKIIAEDKPDVKAAIIGTGTLKEELLSLRNELLLENNVDFLGFIDNPLGIVKNAKIFMMTSLWEGTPMSALEAMSLGVPIVSTPTDGLIYLVREGETGFLSNDDNELAKKALMLLNDDQLQRKLSNNTYKRAHEIMNVENYKNCIMNAYNKAF